MTERQGKLLAVLIISLAVLTVAAAAMFYRPPPRVQPAAAGALKPGAAQAVFTTSKGDLVFDLYPNLAPRHVEQFLKLVVAGVYTGATVIRIEPHFVVQIDAVYARPTPLEKYQQELITKIPAEFSDIKHERGTLSMARYDDVDSATASFSVVLNQAPHLDGNYTVFGHMLPESEAVLKLIEAVPVVPGSTKPAEALPILKAVVRPRLGGQGP